jgi:hypothetical protein
VTHHLADLETAADALPALEKRELVQFLLSRLREEGVESGDLQLPSHSLLEIEPVSVGALLRPWRDGNDLLGEMLEGRQ